MTSNSATASRSFGRPAARFVSINIGSPRHWHVTPKTSMSWACPTRSAYAGPPAISPSVSSGPRSVSQSKVEPHLEGRNRPFEGKSGGGAARIWRLVGETRHESSQIVRVSIVDDVEVQRQATASMDYTRDSTDDDERDFVFDEEV